MDVLVSLLEPASACSGELANAASNLSYEPANCSMLLRAQGVPRLLRLLSSGGEEVHLNAAAALQTVSFQADGRAALLKAGSTAPVLQRLNGSVGSKASGAAGAGAASQEGKLQQRLVGALHNLASCAEGISALRQHGGVAAVASLLGSGHPGVAAAAAGAVQNMSLEARACRKIRMQPRALEALAALLIGPDTQASRNRGCVGHAVASLSRHIMLMPAERLLAVHCLKLPCPPLLLAGGSVRCRRPCQPGRRDRRWEHTAGQ